MKRVYFDESWRSTSYYSFAVYQLNDGSFVAVANNKRKRKDGSFDVVFEEKWPAKTKSGVGLDYLGLRLGKIFKNSFDFFVVEYNGESFGYSKKPSPGGQPGRAN